MSIQDTPTLMTGLFAVVQAIFLLLLTPLFTGISRQIRANALPSGAGHYAGLP